LNPTKFNAISFLIRENQRQNIPSYISARNTSRVYCGLTLAPVTLILWRQWPFSQYNTRV